MRKNKFINVFTGKRIESLQLTNNKLFHYLNLTKLERWNQPDHIYNWIISKNITFYNKNILKKDKMNRFIYNTFKYIWSIHIIEIIISYL
jgi:hypothetical protein